MPRERAPLQEAVVVAKVLCSAAECTHRDLFGHCRLLAREWTDAARVAQGTAVEVRCHSFVRRR